jgi:phospholipid/cholesterol/gamma-HCH transport system substrate-binding protein
MAAQKTKFAVGLFVAIGIALAILVTIWLGMSRFLEKGQFYVTYFDESVQGLDVDSPVKYRGVFTGRVESIGVAPDSKLIKVILKIESGQKLDQNIVAQLKSVGITGSMFVELDQKRADESDQSPPLSFPSEYPIIASKPSEISGLMGGFEEILNQIKALDLEEISGKKLKRPWTISIKALMMPMWNAFLKR